MCFHGILIESCEMFVGCVLLVIYEGFADSELLYVFYEVFGAVHLFGSGVRIARVFTCSGTACSPPIRLSIWSLHCNLAFRLRFRHFSISFVSTNVEWSKT